MAVSIIDYAAQLLCQQGTTSQCQQLIAQYPDVMNQIFFFLLFPIVFLIIFVYILSDVAVPQVAKKFKFLIAVVIFIFIIIQGYYHIFALVSKFWLYFVVLLVGLYVFFKFIIFRKHDGGGGGGGSNPSATAERRRGFLASGIEQGKKRVRRDLDDHVKAVEDALDDLEAAARALSNKGRTADPGTDLGDRYFRAKANAKKAIKRLEAESKIDLPFIGGTKKTYDTTKYWDRVNKYAKKARDAA